MSDLKLWDIFLFTYRKGYKDCQRKMHKYRK